MDKLAQEHHIYMTRNGRISMAGEKQPPPPFCTTATLPIGRVRILATLAQAGRRVPHICHAH